MLFRLALALGRTVEELRATLSYREFQDWCLFYRIEPWGESRADLRSGQLCATFANVHRREGSDPFTPADFMPYLEKPEVIQPVDERLLTDDELADWADAAIYGIPPA